MTNSQLRRQITAIAQALTDEEYSEAIATYRKLNSMHELEKLTLEERLEALRTFQIELANRASLALIETQTAARPERYRLDDGERLNLCETHADLRVDMIASPVAARTKIETCSDCSAAQRRKLALYALISETLLSAEEAEVDTDQIVTLLTDGIDAFFTSLKNSHLTRML